MNSIIKSNLRLKILEYYFNRPGSQAYVRELARELAVDPTNLSRELVKLEEGGIFESTILGNSKYFKIRKDYIFYSELKSIVAKSIGIEKKFREAFIGMDGLEIAFIYGSYAKGIDKAGSDVDLFLIGTKINTDLLLEKISQIEKKIGREINYRLYGNNELSGSRIEKNSFLKAVLGGKKIFIIGNEKDIRKFA